MNHQLPATNQTSGDVMGNRKWKIHLALESIDLIEEVNLMRFFDKGALEEERILFEFPQLGYKRAQLVLDLLDGPLTLVNVGR